MISMDESVLGDGIWQLLYRVMGDVERLEVSHAEYLKAHGEQLLRRPAEPSSAAGRQPRWSERTSKPSDSRKKRTKPTWCGKT